MKNKKMFFRIVVVALLPLLIVVDAAVISGQPQKTSYYTSLEQALVSAAFAAAITGFYTSPHPFEKMF